MLDATQNQGVVISDIIDRVSAYMSPIDRGLGQNVYLSELNRIIQSENGVITVSNISVFNKVGGQYSSAQTSMLYSNSTTKQIQPVDETLFAQPNKVYQIRFPEKDIIVRVKNFQSVSFTW